MIDQRLRTPDEQSNSAAQRRASVEVLRAHRWSAERDQPIG
jgi:hypothetical protein